MNLFNFNKLVGVTSYLRCFPVHEHQLCFLIFIRNNLLKQKMFAGCCLLLGSAPGKLFQLLYTTHKNRNFVNPLSASNEKYFYCHKLLLILPFSGRKLYVEIEFLIIGNCAANSLEIYLWVFLGLQLREWKQTNHRKILRNFILIFPPLDRGNSWTELVQRDLFKIQSRT